MDHLCKLVKEAEDCGVTLNCDIVGATLAHRTGIAKAWLSRCRQVPHQCICSCPPVCSIHCQLMSWRHTVNSSSIHLRHALFPLPLSLTKGTIHIRAE